MDEPRFYTTVFNSFYCLVTFSYLFYPLFKDEVTDIMTRKWNDFPTTKLHSTFLTGRLI